MRQNDPQGTSRLSGQGLLFELLSARLRFDAMHAVRCISTGSPFVAGACSMPFVRADGACLYPMRKAYRESRYDQRREAGVPVLCTPFPNPAAVHRVRQDVDPVVGHAIDWHS